APLRHRGVRDEPVALDLRDEASNPRSELDALRIELDLRTELTAAAGILELLVLHVSLQVAQRIAEISAWRRRSAVGVRRLRRSIRRQLQRAARLRHARHRTVDLRLIRLTVARHLLRFRLRSLSPRDLRPLRRRIHALR